MKAGLNPRVGNALGGVTTLKSKLLWGSGLVAAVCAVIFAASFMPEAIMGTNYVTTSAGDWTDGSIWSTPPPNPLPVGDSIIVQHNVSLNIDIIIYGDLLLVGRLVGDKDIFITSSGTLVNRDSMNVDVISNQGTITNLGGITTDHNIVNSGSFVNESGANLILTNGKRFDNFGGSFLNSGYAYLDDELDNENGVTTNNGTMIITNEFWNDNGTFTTTDSLYVEDVKSNNGGTIENTGGMYVEKDLDNEEGTLINSGNLDIDVKLKNKLGSIVNSGTLTVVDDLECQDGTISNSGSLTIGATLKGDNVSVKNTATGIIDIGVDYENDKGFLDNDGDITVGRDFNNKEGSVVNDGSINIGNNVDNTDGTITNSGTLTIDASLFGDRGSVTNTATGIIDVGGDYDNDKGSLDNNGDVTVGQDFINEDGSVTNDGTLIVGNNLDNKDGTITNNGYVRVVGNLAADNASLLNGDWGYFDVCGELDMHDENSSVLTGTVTVCRCDSISDPIVNPGTIGSQVIVCSVTLPTTLSSFEGHPETGGIAISWEASESGTGIQYRLEKSRGNGIFLPIHHQEARGEQHADYQFLDADVLQENTYFYRIAMIDVNGDITYSSNIEVSSGLYVGVNSDRIWPNPLTGNQLTIGFGEELNGNLKMNWYTLSGELAWSASTELVSQQSWQVEIPSSLKSGTYLLRISDGRKIRATEKLLLRR